MKTFWRSFALNTLLCAMLVIVPSSCHGQTAGQIETFSQAIAKAEGFYVRGSVSKRCHNPGDLKIVRGWRYAGQVGVCKGGHVHFRNDAAGWSALHRQIESITEGTSKHYTVDMTISQMGRRYAGRWSRWSSNVAHNLRVSRDQTLREYFDIPPSLKVVLGGHNVSGRD